VRYPLMEIALSLATRMPSEARLDRDMADPTVCRLEVTSEVVVFLMQRPSQPGLTVMIVHGPEHKVQGWNTPQTWEPLSLKEAVDGVWAGIQALHEVDPITDLFTPALYDSILSTEGSVIPLFG